MVALLTFLIFSFLVHGVPSLPTRALLNIFGNEGCTTRFDEHNIQKTIPAGEGNSHCFRHHVSCIKYDLTVQNFSNGQAAELLVVIAESSDIKNVTSNVLQSYKEGSECTGSRCHKKVDVDESKDYTVLVINTNFTKPNFDNASGRDVIYNISLDGCPTTSQRIVLATVVVVLLLAVCGCLSCCVIAYRRRSRMKEGNNQKPGIEMESMPSQPSDPYSGGPVRMSSNEPFPTASAYEGSNAGTVVVHSHVPSSSTEQSAIPWAASVTSPIAANTQFAKF